MIHRNAGQPVPTNEEIAATFKKIKKMIPADQVATITQARDSIGGLLGICLAVFDAWQKLDLVISLDSNQKKLATEIAILQEAKEGLAKTLEIAKTNHSVAMATLSDELETQKTTAATEKAILNTEIQGLQKEKVALVEDLAEQKKVFEGETAAALQAKDEELARLQEKVTAAEGQLVKVQTTMANLRSKLEQ